MNLRVGLGFDFHPFEQGRKLFLGGVEIPRETGLKGHSDADALLHAVADALLGAAGLRDIGFHFPDTDPRNKDIRSTELLREVVVMIRQTGYRVSNVDVVVIAEKPRIQPFVEQIRSSVSHLLGVGEDAIGIKATTMERRGAVGRGEGIAVQAVALLSRDSA